MKQVFMFLLALALSVSAYCTGEAGTYFNIYVPPSNVNEGKDVSLIVTALYDNTTFRINDTGEDGDTDDSAKGMLMAGQSYILSLRNGGVNDDAAHAGEPAGKQDGDHFLITANQLVLVSQSTKSDWQHDWLPSINKTSKGNKFFIYGNESSNSPNDLNVMAYENNTRVAIYKISTRPTLDSGYTHVSLTHDTLVAQLTLSPGQDIIYHYHVGRDMLKPGETYMVQTNKDVTVQYGALYTDEQDGGGFVPSSNGTSSGNLFYLAAPFEDSAQQEIRVVSYSNNNSVLLERYNNGQWITVKRYDSLNRYKAAEWVGATSRQTYATIFRVTCSAGKTISVFEGNWIETGGMRTSDVASMASSESGNSSSQNFSVYMPVPCDQGNITDPFTGNKMSAKGTHAYIFGNRDHASRVTVKDANTNGAVINRTYTIPAGFYADCALDSAQWKSIYNGTGTMAGGPQRPYLLINSVQAVSVMVSNHNDNWMMYYGAGVSHSSDLQTTTNKPNANPGDTVTITTHVCVNDNGLNNCSFGQTVDDGLRVLSSFLVDSTSNTQSGGHVSRNPVNGKTTITYDLVAHLDSTHHYGLVNLVMPMCAYNDGTAISQNTLLAVETTLTAGVDSNIEMSASSVYIANGNTDSVDVAVSSAFTMSEISVDQGQGVLFTATTSGVLFNWDFGDGQNGLGEIINHIYDSVGGHNVILTVSNAAGCSAVSGKVIQVNPSAAIINGLSNVNDGQGPGIWSSRNKIYVDFQGLNDRNGEIKGYNFLGQEVFAENVSDGLLYTREMNNISLEYLVVTVKIGDRLFSKKVMISNGRNSSW